MSNDRKLMRVQNGFDRQTLFPFLHISAIVHAVSLLFIVLINFLDDQLFVDAAHRSDMQQTGLSHKPL